MLNAYKIMNVRSVCGAYAGFRTLYMCKGDNVKSGLESLLDLALAWLNSFLKNCS